MKRGAGCGGLCAGEISILRGGFAGGVFALAVLTSCTGEAPRAQNAEVVSRDSAGVTIVETPGMVLNVELPWSVGERPDLELGGPEVSGATAFDHIEGLAGLSDGRFVVVDGGSAELRWFSASGTHLLTTGGRGEGPGEFSDPRLIPQFGQDSLLVYDRRGFSRVSADGNGNRTFRLPTRQVGTPRVGSATSVIYLSASSSEWICSGTEHCRRPVYVRSVSFDSGESDTLAVFQRYRISVEEGGMTYLALSPLDQKVLVASAPVGPVLEGGPLYELHQFDTAGRLRAVYRVKDPDQRLSPRDAMVQSAQEADDPAQWRRIYGMMDLPEAVPAFQTLLVDALGWYWAELFRAGPDTRSQWLVFDSDGAAQGVVELPNDFDVRAIGEDYLLGIWTDDLDVEYVRRYSLNRAASALR